MSLQLSGVTLGNITGGPSSINLYDLADVSIVSPQTGQFLRYNGVIEEWQNAYINTEVYDYLDGAMSGTQGVSVTYTPGPNTIAIGLGAITPSSVASSGTVTGSNLSGTNTGDQTITLTGDVTGSGTGSFAATLATVNGSPQADTFRKVTVTGKGLVIATSAVVQSDITTALSYTPVNRAGDTMTGFLILNADPTAALGAVTKQYVDTVSAGLNVHASCVTATTTDLATSSAGTVVYNNGAAGVGATLTTTGSFATIGGYATADGNRILVKNEATQANNGIYVRTSATVLTRASDFDNSPSGEIEAGDFTFISGGTLVGTNWVQITPSPITVGTTSIIFTQLSGPGVYVGGAGIDVTSNTISNLGVLSNIAGTGIGVSGATGNVTISNLGVTSITGTTDQITTSASTGAVTLSLPSSVTIGGTMTATTFVGSLTGASSLNVLKAGDTMTGNLGVNVASPIASLGVAASVIVSGTTPYIALSSNQTTTPSYIEYDTTSSVLSVISSGSLSLKTGGVVERMTIDATGLATFNSNVNVQASARVGYIASTDVNTISGISTANYGITYGANYTGFGGPGLGISGYYGLLFATSGTERARIDDVGNFILLGDGQRLRPRATSTAGIPGLRIEDDAGTRTLEVLSLGSTASSVYGANAGESIVVTGGAGALKLGTNSLTRVTISGAGAVTIAAPTSGSALVVNGDISAAIPGSNGFVTLQPSGALNTGYIEFMAANGNRQGYIGYCTTTGAGDSGTVSYVAGLHAFTGNMSLVTANTSFSISNGAYMRNNQGTYAPFEFYGVQNSYQGISTMQSGGHRIAFMWDVNGNGGSYDELSGIWHTYYVVSNSCLAINGTATIAGYAARVNGALYADGDITAYSDARLKSNVQTVEAGLDKVLRLRGVTYFRNDNGDLEKGKRSVGVIAQEVEEVMPELVHTNEEDGMKGVNYGNMVALLIEAVKDLNAKVVSLQAEVASLKA